MSSASEQRSITLFEWVWRAYFKASLVPLLVLEIALVSVYFFSNRYSATENIHTVRSLAEQELSHLAAREANGINHQLDSIASVARYLQNFAVDVMSGVNTAVKDDPARFAFSKEGAYYTTKDTGGSAVFYSGFVPIGKAEKAKALATASLDPALIGIKKSFPLVSQLYLNTFDSLNRIYPYFDVISQYPAKMDIPSYNFYYEADAAHNPKRGEVWTDAYIDPAGQGWMTSCIAPVYNLKKPDFLEGVVGIDITIGTIVEEVKKLEIPWQGYAVLISRTGTILALPKSAEADWGIKDMTHYDYAGAIQQDTFRDAQFNISAKSAIAKPITEMERGVQRSSLTEEVLMAWATIPATGWKIIIVAPEATIFKPANLLADRLNDIALLMVGGMLLFYAVFFFMLHSRAKGMSLSISDPLKEINAIVDMIAAGAPVKACRDFAVVELNSTAEGIQNMGLQLEAAKIARYKAAAELSKKTEQLQIIFDVSPSGYLLFSNLFESVLANSAFCYLTGISQEEVAWMSEQDFLKRLQAQAKKPEAWPTNFSEMQRIELVRPRPTTLVCGARDILLQSNSVMGKVYFFHDITRDEEIDRIKNDFLTHATHELRTPLSSILGYAELLQAGRVPPAMQTGIFANIYRQSQHMVKMINELLDLTNLAERAGVDFNIMPYSLNELIEAALSSFTPPPSRADIIFNRPRFDITVHADRPRFIQVLVNILDNAYKYSQDGDVSVSVELDNVAKYATVLIEDQGLGMTENELAQVFDRFYRADKSGNIRGTGLGLSLAKEIMTVLNGSIEINSQIGEGSTVRVKLPVQSIQDESHSVSTDPYHKNIEGT